jgi:hypothetical protein
VLMDPELAIEIAETMALDFLSARPREVVELIAMAPRLYRAVGTRCFFAACVAPGTAVGHPLLEYIDWLCSTPAHVRAGLPPSNHVIDQLQQIALDGVAA